jgi:hypothetical protein
MRSDCPDILEQRTPTIASNTIMNGSLKQFGIQAKPFLIQFKVNVKHVGVTWEVSMAYHWCGTETFWSSRWW